jgi:hypothetical protein
MPVTLSTPTSTTNRGAFAGTVDEARVAAPRDARLRGSGLSSDADAVDAR